MIRPLARVPLVANGLDLVVELILAGRLAGCVTLRVYAGRRPTSVGATFRAQHAATLAAAILAKAQRAAERELFAPPEVEPHG
jgi:hypothetical protein